MREALESSLGLKVIEYAPQFILNYVDTDLRPKQPLDEIGGGAEEATRYFLMNCVNYFVFYAKNVKIRLGHLI